MLLLRKKQQQLILILIQFFVIVLLLIQLILLICSCSNESVTANAFVIIDTITTTTTTPLVCLYYSQTKTKTTTSTTSTTHNHYYYNPSNLYYHSSSMLFAKGNTNTDAEEEEEYLNYEIDEEIINNVSDAEALLACRAYLQRRNRLNDWTAGEERKRKRKINIQQAKQSDAVVGFFWEDPDELIYYDRSKQHHRKIQQPRSDVTNNNNDNTTNTRHQFRVIEGTDYVVQSAGLKSTTIEITESDNDDEANLDHIDDDNDDKEEDDVWETVLNSRGNARHPVNPISQFTALDTITDDVSWENSHLVSYDEPNNSNKYFKINEIKPSESHSRRSKAAKKMFANPVWKEKWYEKRWGGKVNKKSSSIDIKKQRIKNKLIEERLRSNKFEKFLSHPELVTMDENEIAYAIQSYIQSNQKRIRKRYETIQQRKNKYLTIPNNNKRIIISNNNNNNNTITETQQEQHRISRDALFTPDIQVLQERQKKRSEIAKKAYHSRIDNNNNNNYKSKNMTTTGRQQPPPSNIVQTPNEALKRIEYMLNNDNNDDDNIYHDKKKLQLLYNDVQIIIQITRLYNRKNILYRIVNEIFHLRGKCIPIDNNKYKFITTCTINEISNFIIYKINNRLIELNNNNNNSNKSEE